jgi:hypothetical protein
LKRHPNSMELERRRAEFLREVQDFFEDERGRGFF